MAKDTSTDIMRKGIRSATAFLKRCGCTPIKGHYSQNYHYNSGFFRSPRGVLWYWSTSDDRYPSHSLPTLFRVAADLSDYSGRGDLHNRYPKTEADFIAMIELRDKLVVAA